jgi:hypothetical protein
MTTCELAQDAILQSDDPAGFAAGESEFARHVARCAACQEIVARVVRIEAEARALVAPGESRGFEAKCLPIHGDGPRRRLTLRPAWWTGIAAMLLVGIGIGAYVASREGGDGGAVAAAEPAVVEDLIDWNLAMADADEPRERERIYTEAAPKLEVAVGRAKLSDEDRRAARRLLENGAWLRTHADPAERVERFCDLQDVVVGRMDSAAAADDAVAVGRLGPKLGRVQKGLGADVKRLYATTNRVPAAELQLQRQLERIAKRQAEAERRLEAAATARDNKAARQALRRAMDAARTPKRPADLH